MRWSPTCELRVAVWQFSETQTITKLQQKWVSDYPSEPPQWRNVEKWYMPTSTPVDAVSYEGR